MDRSSHSDMVEIIWQKWRLGQFVTITKGGGTFERSFLMAIALAGGAAFTFAQTSHEGQGDGLDHSAHGQAQEVAGAALSEPGRVHLRLFPKSFAC